MRNAHLQKLCGNFAKLHMFKLENILEYFARVLAIYNQLKRYEEKVKETHVIKKILRSLQKKFHYVIGPQEKSHCDLRGCRCISVFFKAR